jgi:hypothetical protein
MAEWQKVYEDSAPHRVEIVKAILDEKGLSPVVVNRKDNLYHFGRLEVRVAPDHVIKAIKIIKEEIKFG